MKRLLSFLLAVMSCQAIAQTTLSVDFGPLVDRLLRNNQFARTAADSVRPPVLYNGKTHTIRLSDRPIPFAIREVAVPLPSGANYPVNYSVMYENRLVSLLETGRFLCLTWPALARDTTYEAILNKQSFQRHWVLDNQLIGLSGGQHYQLGKTGQWLPFTTKAPLLDRPKLFEDDTYVVIGTDHGEWGGTVYFYNKHTQQTHFTKGNAVAVRKQAGSYYILSSLGHGTGFVDGWVLADPRKLPKTTYKGQRDLYKGQALGYADSSAASQHMFRMHDLQLFAEFNWQGRTINLLHWHSETVLAEREGTAFQIVHPFIRDYRFYTHNPVTLNYGPTTLITLDFYGEGLYNEVGCILIEDKQITRLKWVKK